MRYFLTAVVCFFLFAGARGQGEFSLPTIPDTLKSPECRASFLALNYWNNLTMSGVDDIENDQTEQAFVDFLTILPICPDQQRKEALKVHVDRMAKATQSSMYYFCDLYEKYLLSADSPMQNQELMISFLESFVAHPEISKLDKMRAEYQLEIALKNPVGGLACDVTVVTIDGQKSSLFALSGSQYTMVMFYNPDCNSCAQQIAQAIDSPEFSDAVSGDILRAVAIYPGNDSGLWHDLKSKIPHQWCNAMAQEPVDQIYDLTSIPTIYLLNAKHNVVLKNTTILKIVDYLGRK